MAVRVVGSIMSVVALCLAIPSLSLAEHAQEITVTIGDTTLNSSSPHTSIPIANTYTHAATGGSITISNLGTGGARIELSTATDDTDDSISLLNAKITANNAFVTNFPITFKRRMVEGPNANPLYYKLYAKGLFNQATGSSIYLGWFVKNPLSSGFRFLDSKQYTPGSLAFTIAPAGKVWPTPPNMDDDRVLKVEFTVKLANGKWLDFDSTVAQPRKIVLYSSGTPDVGRCAAGDTDCVTQEEPPLSLPYEDEARNTVGLTEKHCKNMFKQPEVRPCFNDKGDGD